MIPTLRFLPLLILPSVCSLVARGQAVSGSTSVTASGSAPEIAQAEQAIAANLPEVAIVKLKALLDSGSITDDAVRQRADQDLTQAMLAAGDTDGALERLEYPQTMQERLWKGEALSANGQWDDAVAAFGPVVSDGPADLQEAAAIGEAEALHALDRDPEARTVLETLVAQRPSTIAELRLAELYLENNDLPSARKIFDQAKPQGVVAEKWRGYVQGRINLAERKYSAALEVFQQLLADPHGLTQSLEAGLTIGVAEARLQLSGPEVADDGIEAYISDNAESPYLEEMFRRLDQLYAGEDSPSEAELQHWADAAPPRRAALALYYIARLQQRELRQDKAIHTFADFVQRYPASPLAFESWMQLGELYLDTSKLGEAGSAFEGAMRASGNADERARAEVAAGNADFAQADYLHAAEQFDNAAARSQAHWLEATYDSALAWLHVGNISGNYDRFLQDYDALSRNFPETDERRNLLLEEGLLQAHTNDPRAAATLQSFIRDFPDNRRVDEAQVALAELVYEKGDPGAASQLLTVAYISSPQPDTKERADFLGIFLADSAPHHKDDNVIKLGLKFLNDWPNSTLRAQVRMKLGEIYFRREDYANAGTQFETLAEESPNDPLVDKALILAGQSADKSMNGDIQHAFTLYERVAHGTGPLRLYARQEEALLEVRAGHAQQAIIIYDEILRSNPDTQLRLAGLCGKADCLVATASEAAASPTPTPAPAASPASSPAPAVDPLKAAIALYDEVKNDPDVTTAWRDEALYKKGDCLAKQGLADDALTAFYDVLNSRKPDTKPQPDFFWFEKAGNDAAAILEGRAQWPGAISVLEKMAQAGGPRGPEAQKAADQLRLKHFVWE
jgi:tetratricopeptide (TPR) repeat protein